MRRLSRIHIAFVGNQILKAMMDCTKGSYIHEKNGESYMSIPIPDPSFLKKQICTKLETLCKNVMEIEYSK